MPTPAMSTASPPKKPGRADGVEQRLVPPCLVRPRARAPTYRSTQHKSDREHPKRRRLTGWEGVATPSHGPGNPRDGRRWRMGPEHPTEKRGRLERHRAKRTRRQGGVHAAFELGRRGLDRMRARVPQGVTRHGEAGTRGKGKGHDEARGEGRTGPSLDNNETKARSKRREVVEWRGGSKT